MAKSTLRVWWRRRRYRRSFAGRTLETGGRPRDVFQLLSQLVGLE